MNKRLSNWVHSLLTEWSGADARDAARQFLSEERLTLEEIQEMVEDHITDLIRKVLRQRDGEDMPLFANLTTIGENGERIQTYRRRDHLTPANYRRVVHTYVVRAFANGTMAAKFAEEARLKYGLQLELPPFIAQLPEHLDTSEDESQGRGIVTTETLDARFPTPLGRKGQPYPLQPCTGCGRLTNHQFYTDGWQQSRPYCAACYDRDRLPAGVWR